jgi:cytochrome c-type biogenesis protein CcmH
LAGAIAIVSLAVAVYAAVGRPDPTVTLQPAEPVHRVAIPAADQDLSVAPVESLLTGLEQRLERESEDGKGWLLLAKSYEHLGRIDEAIAAYARARELGKSDLLLESRLVKTAYKGKPANQTAQ